IECENLPSEAETNVPRVVAGLRNARREDGIAVEGIACAEPLTAELTRHVPAERSERHLFGCRKLDGAREIFAIGAEVQEVRRPIEIHAERPISPGVGDLAVDFVEAGNRFRDVAIWKEGKAGGSEITKAVRIDAGRCVADAARIIIFPNTDIEDDRAPR